MKQLVLIRHAKSSWENPELDDHDRPLNNRGLRNAPMMGARLAASNIQLDRMISSTAVRAVKTAQLFAAELDYPPNDITLLPELFHASSTTMLELVQQLKSKWDCVAIVGHNPGMTTFAQQLSNEPVGNNLPTAAIVRLEFQISQWQQLKTDSGLLLDLDYPKKTIELG